MQDGTPAHVIERDESLVVALWNNVFLTLWRDAAALRQLERLRVLHEQVDRQFPSGFCALAVMSMSSLQMDAETRAAATRLSDNPGRNLHAIAQVILGQGFAAAATRAMASGLALLRHSQVESKFFNDVFSAAVWLSPRFVPTIPGETCTANDLALAIDRIYAPP